jgi:hypothetical protein
VQVTVGLVINSQGQPLMLPDNSEITLAAEANSNGAAPDFFADCERPPPQTAYYRQHGPGKSTVSNQMRQELRQTIESRHQRFANAAVGQ